MSEKRAVDLANRAKQRNRARAVAVILPCIGVFLFASPLIQVTSIAPDLFGLPAMVVYVFGVWLALILLTYRATRSETRDRSE